MNLREQSRTVMLRPDNAEFLQKHLQEWELGFYAESFHPEMQAAEQFDHAYSLYLADEPALSPQFLQRAINICDRVIEDVRKGEKTRYTYTPQVEGGILKIKALAEWIRNGAWDPGTLSAAASALAQFWGSQSGKLFDSFVQYGYLECVRLALLARNLELARQLIAIDRKFTHAKDEFKFLKSLIEGIEKQKVDGKIRAQFEKIFEVVRDPKSKYLATNAHLEYALLKQMYFENAQKVDMKRAFDESAA